MVMCAVWPRLARYGHGTPLGHGQDFIVLCEIWSESNMTVMNYGSYKDNGYLRSVTLALEIWP